MEFNEEGELARDLSLSGDDLRKRLVGSFVRRKGKLYLSGNR